MPMFTFRAVMRAPDGALGPTLHEQMIASSDELQAIEQAKAIDLDMAVLGANAVYLSAEDGRAIWSLHAVAPVEDVDVTAASS